MQGAFYPITILLYTCYLSLITISICNLHVDWKSQGSYNLRRLKQLFKSWILLLASVEIAPFGEIYKYDRKTGKVVDGSIPLHTTFNQTLFVRLQTTFSAPGLKGPPGASSVWIVCQSVCLSICPFIRLSVIPSRLQTKCNI